jgi:hypothetical protein
MRWRAWLPLLIGLCLLGPLSACAPEIGGRASFPLLSRAPLPGYTPVSQVDEKRCTHIVLFLVGWGSDPNHEALVTEVLAKYSGDAIVDANLIFFSIPAIFYNQQCARVTGTVVRRAGSGASAIRGAAPLASTPPAAVRLPLLDSELVSRSPEVLQ